MNAAVTSFLRFFTSLLSSLFFSPLLQQESVCFTFDVVWNWKSKCTALRMSKIRELVREKRRIFSKKKINKIQKSKKKKKFWKRYLNWSNEKVKYRKNRTQENRANNKQRSFRFLYPFSCFSSSLVRFVIFCPIFCSLSLPGTENVLHIVGVGKAAQMVSQNLQQYTARKRTTRECMYIPFS